MGVVPNTRTGRAGGWAEAFGRRHPVAVALAAVAAVAAAPWLWSMPPGALAIGATALVLVGVPHGAVDHRVARPMLRPRLARRLGAGSERLLGPGWFAAFSLPYLALAAAILGAWLVAPALSLVAFLTVSVLHFGTEDAEGRGAVALLARGGAPVALPILIHPERTARFFEVLGGDEATFAGLTVAAWAWTPLAALHLMRLVRRGARRELLEVGAVGAAFAALPPLAGFAFYFLVVHSPRHMVELARRHAPESAARGWSWALRRSVPLTAVTFALGALVLAGLDGSAEERFLRATFWGLAALTVPHMILHHIDRRWGGARLI